MCSEKSLWNYYCGDNYRGRRGGKLRINCGNKIDRCGDDDEAALRVAVNVSACYCLSCCGAGGRLTFLMKVFPSEVEFRRCGAGLDFYVSSGGIEPPFQV